MAFKPLEEKPLHTEQAPMPEAEPSEATREQEQTEQVREQPGVEVEQPAQPETSVLPKRRPPLLQKKSAAIPQTRDEVSLKIEKILEEGLNDSFQRLSPVARQEFKLKGEQTALKIRDLLKSSRVKAKKILRLILDWLRILPGVNRFFIEQEAKIKVDKILALKNK